MEPRECRWCGAEFVPYHSRMAFCCDEHRHRWYWRFGHPPPWVADRQRLAYRDRHTAGREPGTVRLSPRELEHLNAEAAYLSRWEAQAESGVWRSQYDLELDAIRERIDPHYNEVEIPAFVPRLDRRSEKEMDMGISSKEKLASILESSADARGRVTVDYKSWTQQLGLTFHDVTKLLLDLKEAGMIRTTVTRSQRNLRVTSVRLRVPKANAALWRKAEASAAQPRETGDSRAFKVRQLIRTTPPDPDGFAPLTPEQIANDLGLSRAQVSTTLHGLTTAFRDGLELRYEPGQGRGGRVITGARVIEGVRDEIRPGLNGKPPQPEDEDVVLGREVRLRVSLPETPLLDQYASARAVALGSKDNRFLKIEFQEDPMAEEALALRHALRRALQPESD